MEKEMNKTKNFWSKTGKVLNVSWKVALVVIGVFAAILILVCVREQAGSHCGKRAHRWDMGLSANICVHYFGPDNVRVYDRKREKYVTPHLKWVTGRPERDSITVFCDMDDMRGFINVKTGEIVVDGRYDYAWVFSEGLAAVVEPGGKLGFIDNTGSYAIAPELDYYATHDYVFKHGVCCIQNKDGMQGLLDPKGEWVLPQEYDFISYIAEADMFVPEKDGKKGLVRNGSFEWAYPMEYDAITWIDAPCGGGLNLYKDFRSMHVAVDGTVLNDFLVDETADLRYMTKYNSNEDDEYAISDKVIAFRVYSLWGVMDRQTGKVLVPAMYGDVKLVSENIVRCTLEKEETDDNVLYDLKGNKIRQ